MNEYLLDILYVVISTALTVGGALLVWYIRTKTNCQFKDEIAEAVSIAVGYVQQTFVDGKKKSDDFKEDNQKIALQKALETTSTLLSTPAKEYLNRGRTESQADEYLVALIEEAVRTQKKEV